MTDASGAPRERPKSPHLMTGGFGSPLLWRWHITMFTSIAHRATGVALYIGALLLAGWAVALAASLGETDHATYAAYMALLGSPLGKLVMFGLTLSVFYHLANGVRHLMWDAGTGLDIKSANFTAVAAIAFAVAATLAVWGIAAMTGAL
ncbi:succinate dehydrogenase, cytochrome b556 subunit [Phenylobacterium aquaticum]|jgi:succinate dehydrogenase / fumarate reductase cytochrome b subunit|uniref:succinate dehydrogenase, cytochrome b556 subunit n=1 Tax=Phenylobacterium aquaticum TaxID=1763816 RepID=UPI001F5C1928|nr:succinate dehydrogenase, cytochrome b556 subunit [Phenylobacterium aquaticum]MCI3132514.1 succinate dehydrogenase, cytochrome b556 subunit [Phenylobacterium aquaticum]